MAGLVPAIHVYTFVQHLRRGCPRQARAWRFHHIPHFPWRAALR